MNFYGFYLWTILNQFKQSYRILIYLATEMRYQIKLTTFLHFRQSTVSLFPIQIQGILFRKRGSPVRDLYRMTVKDLYRLMNIFVITDNVIIRVCYQDQLIPKYIYIIFIALTYTASYCYQKENTAITISGVHCITYSPYYLLYVRLIKSHANMTEYYDRQWNMNITVKDTYSFKPACGYFFQ